MTARQKSAATVGVAALFLALIAAPAAAGFRQPTTVIPAGQTVTIAAPDSGPYAVWNGGHHSTCGHGCVWEIVALTTCPALTVQAVDVTNVTANDVLVKSYFFTETQATRAQERNTAQSRLTYEATCSPPP